MLKCKLRIISLIALGFALVGCDKTKEVLGLTRSSPDEMQVIERPPLSMPPGYGLRPPLPNQEKNPSASHPREEAEASLLKKENEMSSHRSSSEKSATESEILKKANAGATDPDIRKKISSEVKNTKPSIGEQLAFWTDHKPKGQVIDPEEENEKFNGSKMPGQARQTSQEDSAQSHED